MEHIKQDQIINIPNALTVVRILLLPVVVWRFVLGDTTGALIVYMTAMLTDALLLARTVMHTAAAAAVMPAPFQNDLLFFCILYPFCFFIARIACSMRKTPSSGTGIA